MKEFPIVTDVELEILSEDPRLVRLTVNAVQVYKGKDLAYAAKLKDTYLVQMHRALDVKLFGLKEVSEAKDVSVESMGDGYFDIDVNGIHVWNGKDLDTLAKVLDYYLVQMKAK